MKQAIFIVLSFFALGFMACTKTGRVTMNAMRPAQITFPSSIEHFVLLDRSETDKKSHIEIIESVLTGELPQEDKAAVQRALSAFNEGFQTTPRFSASLANDRLKGGSNLTSALPQQLDWKTIDDLCTNYGAQAVLAVELFDTDFIITDGKRKTKRTVGEGDQKREIEVDEWYAKGVSNVVFGLRVYDQVNHSIIDEQVFRRTNTFEGAAASKAEAIAKLIGKSDATAQLCEAIATDYVHRIAPMPIRISRMFYRKHKKAPAIEIGTRYADVNQWKEARETWENAITRADMKRAGFLCYNTAIAYEVFGDLETAIKYAQDAYTKYGNKEARNYAAVLRSRQNDERLLEEQQ